MNIKGEGTQFVVIENAPNKDIFDEDSNGVISEISMNGDVVYFYIENGSLCASFNYGTESELQIFQTTVERTTGRGYILSLAWSPHNIDLYVNSKLVQSINPTTLEIS